MWLNNTKAAAIPPAVVSLSSWKREWMTAGLPQGTAGVPSWAGLDGILFYVNAAAPSFASLDPGSNLLLMFGIVWDNHLCDRV